MIKHKKQYLLAATALLSLAWNGPVQSKTFEDAILYSVQNHPLVMSSRAAEGVARQSVLEEKTAYYPTTDIGAAFGRIYADNTTTRGLTTTRGAGYSWYGEGTANLNQPIYNWSATDHSVNAAKLRYQSAGATLTNQKLTIALQAAQAYLQLLRSKELLNRAYMNEKEISDYFDRIQAAFDNGGAEESELSRAQDFVSLAKNAVVQYKSEVQIAAAGYREIIGEDPSETLSAPSIDSLEFPEILDEAIALALSINSQIATAELEEKASGYDYKREKANQMPALGAEITASKREQDDVIGGESEDVRGLIRANWSYNFGGRASAAERRAVLVKKELEMNKEALKRTIERDVEVAWVSLNLVQQQKKNELDRLTAAKKTYEVFQEQYKGGQQKILDVMSTSFALFNARQDYLNAKYQEINAHYQLMGAIGLPFYQGMTNVASAASAK
jgi:adhesin transport system outer membrane protein